MGLSVRVDENFGINTLRCVWKKPITQKKKTENVRCDSFLRHRQEGPRPKSKHKKHVIETKMLSWRDHNERKREREEELDAEREDKQKRSRNSFFYSQY